MQNKIDNIFRTKTGLDSMRLSKKINRGLTDVDCQAKIMTIIFLIIDTAKAAIGFLLCIFVPQLCPAEPDSHILEHQVEHTCSTEENFQELTLINIVAVVWNFITLATFFTMTFCV